MFAKDSPVALKASASSLCNNIAILRSKEKQTVTYAIVHKAFVCLATVANGSGSATHKQVSCKGEGAHANSSVLQAKWCELPERTVFVITSVKGVQMFEPDGSIMIFWQSLGSTPDGAYSTFARGICAVGDRYICVGTSEGGIMVFDVPVRGTAVKLQETLQAHGCTIGDLSAKDNCMLSTDEEGNIIIWQAGGHFTQVSKIQGFGFPCSSVCFYGDLVIGAYGTGHIRVFNGKTGKICIEVCAHARWINALDVAQESGMLVSVAEDSFVRIWKLSGRDNPSIEMKFQELVPDSQLCGAKFLNPSGTSFGVTGSDIGEVILFSKQ